MTRRCPPLLLALGVLATGCPGAAKHQPPTVPPSGGGGAPTAKAPPARARPTPRSWYAELRQLRSIPALWNAIDRHHDALGRALHPAYHTTRVYAPRRRPRREPPRVGEAPPPHRIERPPVATRARLPRCQRACAHVRAICYAARRICQIAGRLQEDEAITTCKRANDRCEDAKRAARRRCRAC